MKNAAKWLSIFAILCASATASAEKVNFKGKYKTLGGWALLNSKTLSCGANAANSIMKAVEEVETVTVNNKMQINNGSQLDFEYSSDEAIFSWNKIDDNSKGSNVIKSFTFMVMKVNEDYAFSVSRSVIANGTRCDDTVYIQLRKM